MVRVLFCVAFPDNKTLSMTDEVVVQEQDYQAQAQSKRGETKIDISAYGALADSRERTTRGTLYFKLRPYHHPYLNPNVNSLRRRQKWVLFPG